MYFAFLAAMILYLAFGACVSAQEKTDGHDLNLTSDAKDGPGIEFGGGVWIISEKNPDERARRFHLNESGQLVWLPNFSDHLTVKLPDKAFSQAGDVVELTWLYSGEGATEGSGQTNITNRYGSGDFRVGLFDSNGSPVSTSKIYAYSEEIFGGYLGYQVRLSPHVPASSTGGKFAKRTNPMGNSRASLIQTWGDTWGNFEKLNGFGLPLEKLSPLVLRLERKTSEKVLFSTTLNGVTHAYTDDDPENQPRKIDTLAIYFANQRPYNRVILSAVKDTK